MSSLEKLLFLVSFIVPVRWKNYSSALNGKLEVNLLNGKKVLDTAVSNYSYGSLQRILRRALKEIDFQKKSKASDSILLLGLGGGSVIATIREEFHSRAFITAVEFDAQIIEIAMNDFGLNRFEQLRVVHDDAYRYLSNTTETFDYIIVDLFIGNRIPEAFTTLEFAALLHHRLSPEGTLLWNTIRKTLPPHLLDQLITYFSDKKRSVGVLKNLEGTNDVLIVE